MAPTKRMNKKMARMRTSKAKALVQYLESPVCEELAARVDDESEGCWNPDLHKPQTSDVHWEEDNSEDEEEECEYTDDECIIEREKEKGDIPKRDAFQIMLRKVEKVSTVFDRVSFPYQRGVERSEKTMKRKAEGATDLQLAAMDSRPLNRGFLQSTGPVNKRRVLPSSSAWISREDLLREANRVN